MRPFSLVETIVRLLLMKMSSYSSYASMMRIPTFHVWIGALLLCLHASVAVGQVPSSANEVADRQREARRYFISGTTYQLQGNRHAEAILEFQESLKYDSSAVTMIAIARSYVELRKLDRAESYVVQALAVDSTMSDAWEILAEIRIASGRYDEGVLAYERVLAGTPTLRQLYTLGRLYEPRDARKAIDVFQRIVALEPSADVYLRLSSLYERIRDQASQINALEQAVRLDPSTIDAALSLIDVYVAVGRPEDALLFAQRWYDRSSRGDGSAELWGRLLQNFLQDSLVANLYPQVTQQLVDQTCSRFPSSFQMTSMAGAVSLSIRDTDRGYRAINLAANSVGGDAEAVLQLASVVLTFDTPAATATFLLEWQPRHASDPRIVLALADAYMMVPNVERAMPLYYATLELDPSNVEAWLQLGSIYDRQNEQDSAIACYRRALLHDPMNAMAANNYAYLLALQGKDLQNALVLANRALQQYPDQPAYLDTYAWVLYQLGRYEEARLFIEQAIRLGGSATNYDHLGDILERLGDIDGAVRAWEMSLEKAPTDARVREKIDRYR